MLHGNEVKTVGSKSLILALRCGLLKVLKHYIHNTNSTRPSEQYKNGTINRYARFTQSLCGISCEPCK